MGGLRPSQNLYHKKSTKNVKKTRKIWWVFVLKSPWQRSMICVLVNHSIPKQFIE